MSESKWTDEEKSNIQHFFASGEASKKAVRISNSGKAYSIVPAPEMVEIIKLTKVALSEAKLVRNDVLKKAHPDLPEKYRQLYQKSLELQLSGFTSGEILKEIQAGKLHDSWVDWINSNNKKIKIPK
jgi:hypothetical protein